MDNINLDELIALYEEAVKTGDSEAIALAKEAVVEGAQGIGAMTQMNASEAMAMVNLHVAKSKSS